MVISENFVGAMLVIGVIAGFVIALLWVMACIWLSSLMSKKGYCGSFWGWFCFFVSPAFVLCLLMPVLPKELEG